MLVVRKTLVADEHTFQKLYAKIKTHYEEKEGTHKSCKVYDKIERLQD